MAQTSEKAHIERLIAEMTLEEKLGQLTMLSGELVQTGPPSAPVTSEAIRKGRVGSLLNLWGSERVREVQRHAVEGSRSADPAVLQPGCALWAAHIFSDPVRRIMCVRSGPLGADRTGRGAGVRGRGYRSELLSHDRCGARSPLGADGRRPGRGCFPGGAFCASQGTRLPVVRSGRDRRDRRDRQASRRVWSRSGRARVCAGRHLRTTIARGLSSAIPGRGSGRGCGDHAGLHRFQRHADDRERGGPARYRA